MPLSQRDFSILNRQYFTHRLISDFDVWHVDRLWRVDRHELKKQGSLIGVLKKSSFGEMDHFGPKNCASSQLCIH